MHCVDCTALPQPLLKNRQHSLWEQTGYGERKLETETETSQLPKLSKQSLLKKKL